MATTERLLKIKECKENCNKVRELMYQELKGKLLTSIPDITEVLNIIKEIKDDPAFASIVVDFEEGNPFHIITATSMTTNDNGDSKEYVMLLAHNVGITDSGEIVKLSNSKIMYERTADNFLSDVSESVLVDINDSLNCVNMYVRDVYLTVDDIYTSVENKLRKLVSGVSIDALDDSDGVPTTESFEPEVDDAVESVDIDVAESTAIEESDSVPFDDTTDNSEDNSDEMNDVESSFEDEDNIEEDDMPENDVDTFDEDIPDNIPDDIPDNISDNIPDNISEEVENEESESENVVVTDTVDTRSSNDSDFDDDIPEASIDAFDDDMDSENVITSDEPKQVSTSEESYQTKRTIKNRVLPMRASGATIVLTVDIDWVPDLKTNKFGSYYSVVIPLIDSRKGETISFMIESKRCKPVDDNLATISLDSKAHYTLYHSGNSSKQTVSCQEVVEICKANN